LGFGVDPGIYQMFENMALAFGGMGWPAARQNAGDIEYQVVYYRASSASFYGGKANDPMNPDLLNVGGAVQAGTYIDVDGNTVSVDLTEVSGYSAGAQQYLKNNAGTIQWVTVGAC
jgi:hypothetical protein